MLVWICLNLLTFQNNLLVFQRKKIQPYQIAQRWRQLLTRATLSGCHRLYLEIDIFCVLTLSQTTNFRSGLYSKHKVGIVTKVLSQHDPISNLPKISLKITFWQSLMGIRLKTWSREHTEGFSKIWPFDLGNPMRLKISGLLKVGIVLKRVQNAVLSITKLQIIRVQNHETQLYLFLRSLGLPQLYCCWNY